MEIFRQFHIFVSETVSPKFHHFPSFPENWEKLFLKPSKKRKMMG